MLDIILTTQCNEHPWCPALFEEKWARLENFTIPHTIMSASCWSQVKILSYSYMYLTDWDHLYSCEISENFKNFQILVYLQVIVLTFSPNIDCWIQYNCHSETVLTRVVIKVSVWNINYKKCHIVNWRIPFLDPWHVTL